MIGKISQTAGTDAIQIGKVIGDVTVNPSVRTKRPAPFQSPPLPRHLVTRPEVEASLVEELTTHDAPAGILAITAIQGLGGIGKSTIAAVVANEIKVREFYTDGILWSTLGQEPDLLSVAMQWIQALGDYEFQTSQLSSASAHLRGLLHESAILVVIDDVWEVDHALPLLVAGARIRTVLTTRRIDVAEEIGATIISLNAFSLDQAIKLLEKCLGRPIEDIEIPQAAKISALVGYLPLALELAAARVRSGTPWALLIHALEQEVARLEELESVRRRRSAATRLEATLNVSLEALKKIDPHAWEYFVWLGVIPEDVALTQSAAASIWRVPSTQAGQFLELMLNESLLMAVPQAQYDKGGQGATSIVYRLHDLLHDLARRRLIEPRPVGLGKTLQDANRHVVEGYRELCSHGLWSKLPIDGYGHNNIVKHMARGGLTKEIHALLREETRSGNAWYEVRQKLDQTSGYLADLKVGHEVAKEMACAEPASAIGHQCYYALAEASMRTSGHNIHPHLMAALVRRGIWTPSHALALCMTMKAETRSSALSNLAACIPKGLIADYLKQLETVSDKTEQVKALVQLLPTLSGQNASFAVGILTSLEEGEPTSDDLYEDKVWLLASLFNRVPTDDFGNRKGLPFQRSKRTKILSLLFSEPEKTNARISYIRNLDPFEFRPLENAAVPIDSLLLLLIHDLPVGCREAFGDKIWDIHLEALRSKQHQDLAAASLLATVISEAGLDKSDMCNRIAKALSSSFDNAYGPALLNEFTNSDLQPSLLEAAAKIEPNSWLVAVWALTIPSLARLFLEDWYNKNQISSDCPNLSYYDTEMIEKLQRRIPSVFYSLFFTAAVRFRALTFSQAALSYIKERGRPRWIMRFAWNIFGNPGKPGRLSNTQDWKNYRRTCNLKKELLLALAESSTNNWVRQSLVALSSLLEPDPGDLARIVENLPDDALSLAAELFSQVTPSASGRRKINLIRGPQSRKEENSDQAYIRWLLRRRRSRLYDSTSSEGELLSRALARRSHRFRGKRIVQRVKEVVMNSARSEVKSTVAICDLVVAFRSLKENLFWSQIIEVMERRPAASMGLLCITIPHIPQCFHERMLLLLSQLPFGEDRDFLIDLASNYLDPELLESSVDDILEKSGARDSTFVLISLIAKSSYSKIDLIRRVLAISSRLYDATSAGCGLWGISENLPSTAQATIRVRYLLSHFQQDQFSISLLCSTNTLIAQCDSETQSESEEMVFYSKHSFALVKKLVSGSLFSQRRLLIGSQMPWLHIEDQVEFVEMLFSITSKERKAILKRIPSGTKPLLVVTLVETLFTSSLPERFECLINCVVWLNDKRYFGRLLAYIISISEENARIAQLGRLCGAIRRSDWIIDVLDSALIGASRIQRITVLAALSSCYEASSAINLDQLKVWFEECKEAELIVDFVTSFSPILAKLGRVDFAATVEMALLHTTDLNLLQRLKQRLRASRCCSFLRSDISGASMFTRTFSDAKPEIAGRVLTVLKKPLASIHLPIEGPATDMLGIVRTVLNMFLEYRMFDRAIALYEAQDEFTRGHPDIAALMVSVHQRREIAASLVSYYGLAMKEINVKNWLRAANLVLHIIRTDPTSLFVGRLISAIVLRRPSADSELGLIACNSSLFQEDFSDALGDPGSLSRSELLESLLNLAVKANLAGKVELPFCGSDSIIYFEARMGSELSRCIERLEWDLKDYKAFQRLLELACRIEERREVYSSLLRKQLSMLDDLEELPFMIAKIAVFESSNVELLELVFEAASELSVSREQSYVRVAWALLAAGRLQESMLLVAAMKRRGLASRQVQWLASSAQRTFAEVREKDLKPSLEVALRLGGIRKVIEVCEAEDDREYVSQFSLWILRLLVGHLDSRVRYPNAASFNWQKSGENATLYLALASDCPYDLWQLFWAANQAFHDGDLSRAQEFYLEVFLSLNFLGNSAPYRFPLQSLALQRCGLVVNQDALSMGQLEGVSVDDLSWMVSKGIISRFPALCSDWVEGKNSRYWMSNGAWAESDQEAIILLPRILPALPEAWLEDIVRSVTLISSENLRLEGLAMVAHHVMAKNPVEASRVWLAAVEGFSDCTRHELFLRIGVLAKVIEGTGGPSALEEAATAIEGVLRCWPPWRSA